jgi:hypothetical protein
MTETHAVNRHRKGAYNCDCTCPDCEAHRRAINLGRDATNALRREMDLTHCPNCGEPYDLEPCNARHARIQQDRLRVTPSLGVSLKAVLNTVPKKQMQAWKIYKNGDKESRMTVDATDEKDALRVFGNSVGLILTDAYRAYPAKNAGE